MISLDPCSLLRVRRCWFFYLGGEADARVQTPRGAILVFLLLQITHSSPEAGEAVGVSSPLTEYVKLLPERIALPTFWSEAERQLLSGASLEAALEQKLGSLEREFDLLREKTEEISWCRDVWWGGGEDEAALTLEDWKVVDAMYRSRALEIPGVGHAMVPCLDMANHASGQETVAMYETDRDGNAVLLLRDGRGLEAEEEITITLEIPVNFCKGPLTICSYGDEKGASEMVFSYGFLESTMGDARAMFLDLDVPDDDPLKQAKKFISKEAPGVKLYMEGSKAAWESPLLLWACVNEEDGLNFQVLQSNDGGKELKLLWKNHEILPEALRETLMQDSMWNIFQLRAIVTIQERIARQLSSLDGTTESFVYGRHHPSVSDDVWKIADRLRFLEGDLLHKVDVVLGEEVSDDLYGLFRLN